MKVFSSILGSGDGRRRGAGLRIALALSLLAGVLSVLGVALVDVLPASAAVGSFCTTTAGGTTTTTTTTTTFVDGQADSYTVSCFQQTGVSGEAFYPTVSISSGTLPTGATFATGGQSTVCSTGNANDVTTTTSGTGTTEDYIIECALKFTPPSGTTTAVPLTFTPTVTTCTPTACAGTGNAIALNLTYVTPTTPNCLDPASATTTTWYEGTNSLYTVECYSTTGISGIASYPNKITIASGTFPAASDSLSGGSPSGSEPGVAGSGTGTLTTSACGTTTSGSGTVEEYITECDFEASPTSADAGTSTFTFNATNSVNVSSGNGTASANSANLNINVAAQTVTCIDPIAAGATTTFYQGDESSYSVECEAQSGLSGVTAYPKTITINSGALPGDAHQTFAGASQQTCTSGTGTTTTTSGSGTTEEYVTVCALKGAVSSSDTGPYPFTFTATGPGGFGTSATSGTLTVNSVAPSLTGCLDPVAAGATTTFPSSNAGTANTYTVECYSETGVSGQSAGFPNTITPTGGTGLPSDATFGGTGPPPTSACTVGSGTTATATASSGTTEEYITECTISENTVTADNGTYTSQFQSSAQGAAVSGTLTVNISGPSTICIDPVNAGATTTFKEGISNTYNVECYGAGFSSASPNNYPASITANDVTPAGTFLDGTAKFGGTAPPSTCSTSAGGTTTTSGSGTTEEYILVCAITDTPVSTEGGSYAATFTAVPGSNGGSTVTSGNLTVNVVPLTSSCIDPASGGSSTTFYTNVANSYPVECETATGISGTAAYPASIAIASGALPGDATQTFAGSNQQTCSTASGGTTTTTGSGTTEEYILVCALAATPQSDDTGSYPFTFSATDVAGNTTASGTLNVNVTGPTSTCLTPAPASTTTTTYTDGTAGTYNVECYTSGFASASPGNYPSINIASGSLPSSGNIKFGGAVQTTCAVGAGGTTTTSGSGVTEEYITVCTVAGTPTAADSGAGPTAASYSLTFSTVAGANGGTTASTGTLNLKITGTAPAGLCSTCQSYYNSVAGVPFCFDYVVNGVTVANGGLPLTSITPGATPANTTDYTIQNINLANGSAQLCGVMSAAEELTETTLNPVATNGWGSATQTYDMSTYSPCTWSNTDAGGEVNSTYDSNLNVVQTGSQSSFGSSITGGVVPGTTRYYTLCYKTGTSTADAYYLPGGSGVSTGASPFVETNGGISGYTNPSDPGVGSPLGDLTKACGGTVSTASSSTFGSFGSATPTYDFTFPSPWVNGGICTYGSGSESGSNSVGTDTDSYASCPPTQQDVNEGYVDCNTQAGIGTNASFGSGENAATGGPPYTVFNYTQDDQFFSGQPVPQASTVNLSTSDVEPGDTVTITGGTNWWGGSGENEPNSACKTYTGSGNSTANTYPEYGDGGTEPTTVDVCNSGSVGSFDNSQSGDYYPTYAPQVYIGTNSTTAHAAGPVTNSVNLYGNTYYCTGALQQTNASAATNTANPCTMQVGGDNPNFATACPHDLSTPAGAGGNTNNTNPCQNADIGGTFKVPASLTPGTYNVYVDAMNTTPLPGNGPNDPLSAEPVNCPAQTNVIAASNGNLISNGTLNVTSTTGFASSGQVAVAIGPAGTAGGATGTAVLNYTGTTATSFTGVTVSSGTLAVGGSATWTVQTGNNVSPPSSCETSPDANLGSDEAVAQLLVSGDMLVKTTTTSAYGAAGDAITYQYAISNTGGDTLSNVTLSDSLVADGETIVCPAPYGDGVDANPFTLPAGDTETCTGTYHASQSDVNTGSVVNTASVSATNPSSETIATATSSVTVQASNATKGLSLLKTGSTTYSDNGYGVAGDIVSYSYAVDNTGTTTVTGLTVADNKVSVSCPTTTVAPGQTVTCTASYTVTQADVDAGALTNQATASGTASFLGALSSTQSSVTLSASDATSTLGLVIDPPVYGQAGDTVPWTYTVTDTGTTTVSGVSVADNLVNGESGTITCGVTTLAPTQSTTCSGTYTVTQADVDAGHVTDTATATGTTEAGSATSGPESYTVYASNATSGLSLVKSTTSTGFGAAGNTIPYSYVVKDTGSRTISGIAVTDSLGITVTCPSTTLSPGQSTTCTATYTVLQSDVDAGFVTNTASATGTDSTMATVTSNTPGTSSVTVLASSATSSLSLVKSTTSGGYGAAGDSIPYAYDVTNTGTRTISGISVSDSLGITVTCTTTTLAPNASVTCTSSYTVTQTDVDNGSVTNTASATGTDSASSPVTSDTPTTSTVTVYANLAGNSLSLVKSATTTYSDNGFGAAGDVISYSYVVTNTGTTTISGIAVSDNLGITVTCPDATLDPSVDETCTATYPVTQANVDAGFVTNTAVASGTNPQSDVIHSNTPSTSTVTVGATDATESLSLVKSTTSTGFGTAGDTIPYAYDVTNTGTRTISGISVSDSLGITVTCNTTTLAPNGSVTCTSSYTVTQTDVDNGSVTNTASASGFDPQDNSVTSDTPSTSTVTVDASNATSSLSLVKGTTSSGYGAVGDTIPYTYVVKDTGTRSVSGIAVSDSLGITVSCPATTLMPGQSTTCTSSYTVTQTDVDNGSVTNTASATGTDSASNPVTSDTPSTSTVTVYATFAGNSLSLVKSTTSSGFAAAGNTIPYAYVVKDTGTTTVSGIAVSDSLGITVTCPATPLSPGQSTTCTASYAVTQADVDAGYVTNSAVASGTNQQSEVIHSNTPGTSSVTVMASSATKGLSVVKSTTTASYAAAGDHIVYNYVVTNTGSTTITGISVNDSLGISVVCNATTLAPTTSTSCSGTYTATETDVTNREVTNTSSATGTASFLGSVTSPTSNSVSVPSTYTSTATAPMSSTSALGGPDQDVAVVEGNTIEGSPSGGTVTFYECGPTPTPTACTSQTHAVGAPVAVTPDGGDQSVATSGPFTATSTGYWCFAGYYSGGPDYAASSDASVDECYDVTSATSSNQTAPTNTTILLGQADTDHSTVTGNTAGGSPTGAMDFYVCGPTTDATPCTTGGHQVGGPVNVTVGASHTSSATSAPFTPTAVGYWCFDGVYAGDANYKTSSDSSVDECVNVLGPVTIVTTSLPGGTKGVAYVYTVTARGGTKPYKWKKAGRLPRGMGLSKTGVLSGTPIKSGSFTITLKVTDSTGKRARQHEKATQVVTLVIAP